MIKYIAEKQFSSQLQCFKRLILVIGWVTTHFFLMIFFFQIENDFTIQ